MLVYALAPDADPGGVEQAYHQISAELAGVPGLLGNELLREVGPDEVGISEMGTSAGGTGEVGFVVMSEWESLSAFRRWEQGASHRGTTAPLRPYQDSRRGRPFGLYEVTAEY